MTFQASDIGTNYDVGIATRPNPDGSTATVSCLNEDGAQVPLSQVAFMFLTEEENEESVNLIRKDQLTLLSSSNVIDREFTLFPQATQGNWAGGELQKVFSDATAYYQGRGLSWPVGSTNAPGKPATATQTIAGTTTWPGVVAGGFYTGFGIGYAVAYSTAGGAFLRFQGPSSSVTSAALVATVGSAVIIGGQIFFTQAAQNVLYTMSGAGPAIANFATPVIAAPAGQLAAAMIGNIAYVAINLGGSINIYNANLAASFVSIAYPAGFTFQSMAFLGSTLIFVVDDGLNASVMSYDIPSATIITLAQLQGYSTSATQIGSAIQIAAVSGSIFIACTYSRGIDCYLLVGSSLQFITTLSAIVNGTSSLTYKPPVNISPVVAFGPYALFVFITASTPEFLCAYDVQRGAFFIASDFFTGDLSGFNTLAVTTGQTASSPQGVASQWTVIAQANGGAGSVAQFCAFGIPLAGSSLLIPSGRILSSAIDFTSASNKLYRQLVVTHAPIPTGGQIFVAVWLDQDVDNLNTAPDFSTTNPNATQQSTTLLINKIARKLVYMIDYVTPDNSHNAPRPKAVAIQSATGWVITYNLALSDSAITNGQNANEYCFQQQDPQLDTLAARNFLRQLWRQKGGLCAVTYGDGDAYNAVIADYHFAYKKAKTMNQSADRKVRYEGKVLIKLQEDV